MIDERYIILIHKHLRDELNDTDQKTLQHWLDESPEHLRVFQEMDKAWKLSGDYLAGYTPDVERGLATLQKRIRKDQPAALQVVHRQQRVRIGFGSAIAAGLLLLIAALAVWNFWFRPADMLVAATAAGEQKTITLDDGSRVVLNENSQLTYPSFFRSDREVSLSGEAFFEVEHNETQAFTISTSQTNTEVLGTSFNLRAYDNEPYTEVEVIKGLVRLADKAGISPLELEEGVRGTYDHEKKTLLSDQPKTLNAVYWKERRLRFKNHQLIEALEELKSRLNLNVQLGNGALNSCPLTLAIEIDLPKKDIVAVIADSYNASWSGSPEGQYVISGGNCEKE